MVRLATQRLEPPLPAQRRRTDPGSTPREAACCSHTAFRRSQTRARLAVRAMCQCAPCRQSPAMARSTKGELYDSQNRPLHTPSTHVGGNSASASASTPRGGGLIRASRRRCKTEAQSFCDKTEHPEGGRPKTWFFGLRTKTCLRGRAQSTPAGPHGGSGKLAVRWVSAAASALAATTKAELTAARTRPPARARSTPAEIRQALRSARARGGGLLLNRELRGRAVPQRSGDTRKGYGVGARRCVLGEQDSG